MVIQIIDIRAAAAVTATIPGATRRDTPFCDNLEQRAACERSGAVAFSGSPALDMARLQTPHSTASSLGHCSG